MLCTQLSIVVAVIVMLFTIAAPELDVGTTIANIMLSCVVGAVTCLIGALLPWPDLASHQVRLSTSLSRLYRDECLNCSQLLYCIEL